MTLAHRLREHVVELAERIGERNFVRYQGLLQAQAYLKGQLGSATREQSYGVDGQVFTNLELELAGSPRRATEIVVVGAHYDSLLGTVGANDNASGVAALLCLAELWSNRGAAPLRNRSLRFVAFVNEEPPFFHSRDMGSYVYARACQDQGERVVAMLCLETMGYYCDEPGSQRRMVDRPDQPDRGDFILFAGPDLSGGLVRQVAAWFRSHSDFPCQEVVASPQAVPEITWSDHWPFVDCGYPALMVTDTAPFRYPHYHSVEDTPDKLDYERLAQVVAGIDAVIAELVTCQ